VRLKIAQGRVFDPAQGWEGEVRDLYIDGDRIVSLSLIHISEPTRPY